MDADAKKAWDEKRAAKNKKIGERETTEKTTVDYAKMTLEAQTVYMGGLLKWKKAIYKICKDTPDSNECKFADALRAKNEKKKAADGYYKKTAEDR